MDRRGFLAKIGLGIGAAAVLGNAKSARALSPIPPDFAKKLGLTLARVNIWTKKDLFRQIPNLEPFLALTGDDPSWTQSIWGKTIDEIALFALCEQGTEIGEITRESDARVMEVVLHENVRIRYYRPVTADKTTRMFHGDTWRCQFWNVRYRRWQ